MQSDPTRQKLLKLKNSLLARPTFSVVCIFSVSNAVSTFRNKKSDINITRKIVGFTGS